MPFPTPAAGKLLLLALFCSSRPTGVVADDLRTAEVGAAAADTATPLPFNDADFPVDSGRTADAVGETDFPVEFEPVADVAVDSEGASKNESSEDSSLVAVGGETAEAGTPLADATAVHIDVVQDLSQLLPTEKTDAITEEAVEETYLHDLNLLLGAERPWVMMQQSHNAEAAAEPAQPELTYQQELQLLHNRMAQEHPDVIQRMVSAAVVQPLPDNLPLARPSNIASLFSPLKELTVKKTTKPEEPGQTLEELGLDKAELERFFPDPSETYRYTFRSQGGVQRPNRTPRPFISNPLYFEDPNLERCGVGSGMLTEVHSAVRFAANTALLPWHLAATPPRSHVCSAGDCPSCSEFPCEAGLPPATAGGLLSEAGIITGLIFIIP